jgi:protein-tyrosine-phosphatase/predicted ATP-grasp superfamily ATP-dependent carboligase
VTKEDDRSGQGPTGAPGKALVLGSGNGSFLSTIRSLGRRGVEVHTGWCPRDAPAAKSRYVKRAHVLPAPTDERCIDVLVDLIEAERFDLVLPTNDPTLIPLQRARARLEPVGRVCLLPERAFEVAFDKVKTRALAVANRVPVAPGQVINAEDEIDDALAAASYPLVIRPQASFNPDDLDRRNTVCRVYEPSSAREAIEERLRRGSVLVEQTVTGPGWGFEVLAADGEILLSQQHERLHEPLYGGASSYRRTVPRHPAFLEAAARLVRELNYTGVVMFEFKGDPDGRWVLIEINGRFWGSLPLSLAAGIDFPYALWQLLVEGRREFENHYRVGVYARNLKRDLKWAWVNLRADRADPSLATVPLRRVGAEAANILRLREHTDQFTADDPWPGVVEFGQLGRDALELLRGQIVAWTPLQRRPRRRAREAFQGARSILFVCHGNICRSPFAAGLARQMLPPTVEVQSAGTSELQGRRPPWVARHVASEFDVQLESHRSQPVTADLIDRADAVFAFDEHNRHALAHHFANVRGKLHMLGALGSGPWNIADPIAGSERDYRATFAAISAALADAARL